VGYDLFAGIAFWILLPCVLLGYAAYWVMTHRARARVEAAWRAYAEQRGLPFDEASGAWPNRTSPAIRWTAGTTRLSLTVLGRESRAHTRMIVEPEPKLLGTLVAVARGGAIVRLRARPESLEASVLAEPVRRALLGFTATGAASLAYRRGRAVVEWRGRETDAARLDEARALGEAVANAVEHAFRAAAA
jgi:hypothetical protein